MVFGNFYNHKHTFQGYQRKKQAQSLRGGVPFRLREGSLAFKFAIYIFALTGRNMDACSQLVCQDGCCYPSDLKHQT